MTTTVNREEGLKALETYIKAIEEVIMNKKGTFVLQQAPKVVTDMDKADFAKQLERLEHQNAEVDGDDDYPDDEEEQDEAKMIVVCFKTCCVLFLSYTTCGCLEQQFV
ncbi:eukaryotic translation initiation factor 2 subunit 1-like [Xenia sp. Carnegie-2017]|uniref:eukaryotic translation initiation factor 2 subunit 1-like n=1 Tax=Xenia sp. Carnegie-2017 TaxID=2897299 RepID=UPI001F04227C|nr:eukaryotic translation initiation factor 2 subunit 1-like [Xenia sp. Carnegie-2017]